MNRTTALLLAVAALFAHAISIHHDAAHRFAGPYDGAYVGFHLARNWAEHGDFVWNAHASSAGLRGGLESYPSLLWLWMMGASEWLHLPTQPLSQLIGLCAALGVVVLSARFATDRIAGIVTPVLLVASGGLAAAASSGTEIPLVALLVMASFVAFEHRWSVLFMFASALLAAANPAGFLMVTALFVLAALERPFSRRDGSSPTSFVLFLPAAVLTAVGFFSKTSTGASLYGLHLSMLFDADREQIANGWQYVFDAARTSIMPLLVIAPLFALALGKLSGAGLRALGLGVLWTVIVMLEGGGPAPFGLALVPGLPLIYLAIQQGMILGLDTGRRTVEVISWGLIFGAIVMSALGSKFPGNIGPLKLDEWHREWMTPSTEKEFDRRAVLGRMALDDEVRLAADMRSLSSFLNVHGRPQDRILTAAPGLLGYASGMIVEDLFARTHADGEGRMSSFWRPERRADWIAALERKPELILPGRLSARAIGQPRFFNGLARSMISIDVNPTPERDARLRELLMEYELLAVPVYPPGRQRRPPVYLLQRKDAGYAPQLKLDLSGGLVRVTTILPPKESKNTLLRLASLQVTARDANGKEWNLTPTGELVEDRRRCTRTGLLFDPRIRSEVTLFQTLLAPLPDGSQPAAYSARLISPGSFGGSLIGLIGEEVVRKL